ncbi:MAG: hypothetical protein ACP5I6_02485 [Caldisphaera sp.]|jgi:transcription antitermination factor NusA-like protein|nr:hypothetical protein [Caldisphaera sp.]PMP59513.1 MAG: hypothetical protein C0202_02105 [Caldisphaera sp.]
MQIPLDKICVKSGMLCPNCQAKIDKGLYEKWEVDVMRALLELEDKMKEVKEINYKKSIIFDKKLYIFVENLSSHRHELEKILEKKLEKLGIEKVALIEYTNNPKELIYRLLNPIEIKSANIYYSPDGGIYYVIKIPNYEKGKLENLQEPTKRIFKLLTKNDVYFELTEERKTIKINDNNEEEKINQHIDTEKLNKLLKQL